MRIKTGTATCLQIFDAEGVVTVTVITQDIAPGEGRLFIENYGQAWSSYWPGMGARTVAEFVIGCGEDYLVHNLARPRKTTAREVKHLLHLCRVVRQALKEART